MFRCFEFETNGFVDVYEMCLHVTLLLFFVWVVGGLGGETATIIPFNNI